MKYGDAVVLVQKDHSDGSLRRLNAIVLAESLRVPTTADRKPIEGAEKVEHLDLAFAVPTLVSNGGALKTRDTGEIFRLAYDVGPYVDGAWVGYELPMDPALLPAMDDKIALLEDELAEERKKCGAALAKIAQLKYAPSAADLDAQAAEDAAKAATQS